ncbi:Ig-like domain-containing protein, partial [Planococcus sp. SIMBA_160]
PNAEVTGVQSFTYTLNDGQGGSDTANVSVDVEPVPPVADPDTIQLSEDGSVTFDPLANDLLTSTSTLDRYTSPAHGTVVMQ